MTFCNEFDAKNTPQLYSSFAGWMYVNESEAVSPISVLSPGHGGPEDVASRGRGTLC